MNELCKITPTLRKVLEAAEDRGLEYTAAGINVWSTPDGKLEVAKRTLRVLVEMKLLFYPHPLRKDSARLTDLGRGALSLLREADAKRRQVAGAPCTFELKEKSSPT
jgi:hypothetical protein